MSADGESGARLAARLAARMAHDLNNSLAVFSGHIFLLRDSAEPLAEGLDAMERALENAQSLARNLAEVGALGIEAAGSIDVNEVVRAEAAAIPPGEVDLELDATIPPVPGRPADLARAIRAILQNAREANAARRAPIRIVTERADSRARISIEDAGDGVPEVVRRRDFDPLFTTKGARGRGLGITLVRLTALIAGGSLSIEDRPGGGTRVILALPETDEA
jgi:signal transduction histidine kinase